MRLVVPSSVTLLGDTARVTFAEIVPMVKFPSFNEVTATSLILAETKSRTILDPVEAPDGTVKFNLTTLPEPLAIAAVAKREMLTVPLASLILGVMVNPPVKLPAVTAVKSNKEVS